MEEKLKEQEERIEKIKEEAKKDMQGSLTSTKKFVKELLNIRNDTDKAGTIQSIKDNIAVKGHTAWILVFSILVASIGLNVSSTAVVIGAMLISPLMGPILGVGLSIGINDVMTLRRSMINLGVMIGLSLVTSFLFFSIPLFQDATPEILARTQPDVRDVLIAIAGGFALIIAISRPSPQTNTVAGVAIATALMPPLCTAGYGLAIHELSYFLGAMFLFLINTTFIALATFVIVKYLRFPMVKYINSAKQKRIARFASFVAVIVLGASIYTFYNLYLKNNFKTKAETFINSLKDDGIGIIDEDEGDLNFEENSINITVYGKTVTDDDKTKWDKRLISLGLENVQLNVQGGKDDSQMISEFQNLRDQFANNQKIIEGRDASIRDKNERIRVLETELRNQISSKIPFIKISEEAKINYDGLLAISYANRIKTNFKKVDTLTEFSVKWSKSMSKKTINTQERKLYNWLKTRLEIDTLVVARK